MTTDLDAAARLIEALLWDPPLRARFRSDAATVCREAGLNELAEQMPAGPGDAMYTLDQRESKSSLAGVMMATAVEGFAAWEAISHAGQASDAVSSVVSRVNWPAPPELPELPRLPDVKLPELPHVEGQGAGPVVAAVSPDQAAGGTGAGGGPASSDAPSLQAPTESPAGSDAPGGAGPRVQGTAPGSNSPGGDAAQGDPAAGGAGSATARGTLAMRAVEAKPQATGARHSLMLNALPQDGHEAAAATPESAPLEVAGYPGDDAPRAQIAAWMATEARKHGLPGELPVMAALVESTLKNLPGGDADSVGYFQMRTSIWDKGQYRGYGDQPKLQMKWFLDQAASVKQDRLADGRSIDDPQQYGDWIADIENPAAQYRGRYHERLAEAQGLLKDAQAQSPAGGLPPEAARLDVPATGNDQSARQPIDLTALGKEGHGGTASPEALAALENKHLHFDATGIADLKAGRIDPRAIAVLTKLAREHDLTISCMASDHAKNTTGGSVSNHFHGRGIDIAIVDGQPVNPGNNAARKLASQLSELPATYRPSEIGSPWALAGPGHFTDGAHQDHVHVGFDDAVKPDWRPPQDVAAGGGAPLAAAADAPGAPPVQDGEAAAGASNTLAMRAVSAQRAEAADRAGSPKTLGLTKAPDPEAGRGPLGPAAGGDATSASVANATPGSSPPGNGDQAADALTPGGDGSHPGAKAAGAVKEASKYLGTPYHWGGASPHPGFDCSGLMQWAYSKQGIRIPRVTYDQIDAPNGRHISRDHILAGDLVFFATSDGDVHHVGMSLGGDRFIHAPHTGDVVKISNLNEPYYAEQFAGGRRFDAAVGGDVARRAELQNASPDPTAVQAAEAARVRDEAAVRNPQSMVFRALSRQEAANHQHTMQFLAAARPEDAERVSAAASRAGIGLPADQLGPTSGGGGYPGDGAPRAQMAQWLAGQARRRGLPPELPVMASLVESNLKNLRGGDADSVGLFQMRVSGWDRGAYAGYQQRPELQAKWFIDQALAVKRARLAAGDVTFGRDPSSWGEWIADVENPAAQYRGRYQLRLAEARRLLG